MENSADFEICRWWNGGVSTRPNPTDTGIKVDDADPVRSRRLDSISHPVKLNSSIKCCDSPKSIKTTERFVGSGWDTEKYSDGTGSASDRFGDEPMRRLHFYECIRNAPYFDFQNGKDHTLRKRMRCWHGQQH